MRVVSLYQAGNSLWHQLSPITKMIYVLAALLVPLFTGGIYAQLAVAVLTLLFIAQAGVFKKTLGILSLSAFVLVTTLIIQGFFNPDNAKLILNIGPFGLYEEGLFFALGLCAKVLNLLTAFSLLVLTTRPSDLVESLVRKGLSPQLGYVLLSVLLIIPQMMTQVSVITDAQKARGLETEGSLLNRLKAFLPLIGPVVMNALVSTRERALALEVRGFGSQGAKTFLNDEQTSPLDRPLMLGLWLVVLMSVLWRVFTWLS